MNATVPAVPIESHKRCYRVLLAGSNHVRS